MHSTAIHCQDIGITIFATLGTGWRRKHLEIAVFRPTGPVCQLLHRAMEETAECTRGGFLDIANAQRIDLRLIR